MGMMLGDIIAALRQTDDPAVLLEALDLALFAAVEKRAAAFGMGPADYVAGAVDRFCAEADEDAWVNLTGAMQSTDLPGRAALGAMVTWALGRDVGGQEGELS